MTKVPFPIYCVDCGVYICDMKDTRCPPALLRAIRRPGMQSYYSPLIHATMNPQCPACRAIKYKPMTKRPSQIVKEILHPSRRPPSSSHDASPPPTVPAPSP